MNRVTRFSVISLSLLLMASFGTGCKKNKGGDDAAAQGAASAGAGFVRVVHGADTGAVDVAVNGVHVASGLNQNAFVRERVPFPAGASTVTVSAGGGNVVSSNIQVDSGQQYTFVVLGNAGAGFQGVLISDALASAGGKNRFVHGMPAAGAASFVAANGQELVSGLTYTNASGFVSVPDGFQRVTVNAGGAALGMDSVPNNAARAVTTVAVPKGAGVHLINVVDRLN